MAIDQEKFSRVLTRFSLNKLSSEQERCLNVLCIERRDVFLSTPTGSGKSMCYMAIPDVCEHFDDIVLVITPLKSIGKEQCNTLNNVGLAAVRLGDDPAVDLAILQGTKHVTFIFTDPETILQETWMAALKTMHVHTVVVDEAHTVKHWGMAKRNTLAFRDAFSRTGELRSVLPSVPFLVLTATATKLLRTTIKRSLVIKHCEEIIISPDRTNIQLNVDKFKCSDLRDPFILFTWLMELLEENGSECERFLIFCRSKDKCAKIRAAFARYFGGMNCPIMDMIQLYHAKTPDNVVENIQTDMNIDGSVRILICTDSAGMGVNFYNTKNVIHYGPPTNMDTLIQQFGRAGRQGQQSQHLLLFCGQDLPHIDHDVLAYLKNMDRCRRAVLTELYDAESPEEVVGHWCCDVCRSKCACRDPEPCVDGQHPSQCVVEDDDEVVGFATDPCSAELTQRLVILQSEQRKVNPSMNITDATIVKIVRNFESIKTVNDILDGYPVWELNMAQKLLEVISEFTDTFDDSTDEDLSDDNVGEI